MAALASLQDAIGYRFADESLLRVAMAHRSWCAEQPGEASNERLEFLGDAVLGWVVADVSYRRHADLAEGKLTDLRKSLVNAGALAEIAVELGIGEHLLLGKGESAAGGRHKPSILSDALEAVLGAVYLDGGADVAYRVIEQLLGPRMEVSVEQLDRLDHKTQLQELVVRIADTAPVYVVTESGPDHDKLFTATVVVAGESVGQGSGRSKKAAEQLAAEEACAVLVQRLDAAAADRG
ncbi:MAG: ribonuclease III [Ilumatobacteraceae bacterium]